MKSFRSQKRCNIEENSWHTIKKQSDKLAKLNKYRHARREKDHIKTRMGLSDNFIKDSELEKVEEGLSDRISETDLSEFTENPGSEISYVNII